MPEADPRSRWLRRRLPRWVLLIAAVLLLVGGALFGPALYRDAHRGDEAAKLIDVLGLQPGAAVADIGAGDGSLAIALAERLGANAKVLATEIDRELLAKIRASAARSQTGRVIGIEGSSRETNLPEGCCDAAVMADVYHHLTDAPSMNASVLCALLPGGRLAVIDFAPVLWMFWLTRPAGVPADRGGHGVPADLAAAELRQAGFTIDRVIRDWWPFTPRRYCIVARKPLNSVSRLLNSYSAAGANRNRSVRLSWD